MTPKQKQRLEQLASDVFDMHDSEAHRVFIELNALAAEGPPKCGTCTYASKEPKEDLLIYCNNGKSNAEGWQRPDFGCVLHSDYDKKQEA